MSALGLREVDHRQWVRGTSQRATGRPLPVALLGGVAIETLQWASPLSRVVSSMDALLNAAGAVTAGVLPGAVPTVRAGSDSSRRVWAGA